MDAGFTEELFGDDAPPATHYRLGEDDGGFYAEFLTPLHGSGLKRGGEVPIAAEVDLFVPNPTSFIIQKLLIHADRPPRKQAQDLLYIHDTLELFGGSLDELRRLWFEDVRPAMPPRTAKRPEVIARERFAEVTDTIREAARIPQDRRLAPADVQRACEFGLGEILQAQRPA